MKKLKNNNLENIEKLFKIIENFDLKDLKDLNLKLIKKEIEKINKEFQNNLDSKK